MSSRWLRLTTIVAEREIRQRGRSRAFGVSTIVLLLVVAAAVILPVQVPLIIAYALSYTVIYADGANVFYRVLGFLPPTAPIAMPVLYAAGDVPAWQAAVSAVLVAAGTVWMARTAATIYGRSILRTGARVRLRQVLAPRG